MAQVLDVRLRADPESRGPPALVWARQQLNLWAPELADVRAGVRVRISASGVRASPDDEEIPAGAYMVGRIATADGANLALHCDADGYETWRGDRAAAERCAPVSDFLTSTDVLRPGDNATWLDVAVLVGLSGTGFETEAPTGLLLTLGAAECGELLLRATTQGDQLLVEGRSRGGLTWPALLLALARQPSNLAIDHEQRWITLAYAARDSRRQEAGMQLARFASRASDRCLRALLRADDASRVRAIESLARRGAADALPAMLAAAQGDDDARAAVSAAVASLWPDCSDNVRRTARTRAAADPALLAVITRVEHAAMLAGIGTASMPSPTVAPPGAPRTGWASLLALTALALLGRVLMGAIPRGQRIS